MGLSELPRASVGAHYTQHLIRRCTPDDVDFLMQVAEHRYGPKDFDRPSGRAWALARLTDPTMAFFRGERSFGICHIAQRYMAPDRWQAYLTIIASIPSKNLSMEPYRICEAMAVWAKEKGATKFWFSDITGYDLEPMVRHLGARFAGKNYVLDLDDKGGRYG